MRIRPDGPFFLDEEQFRGGGRVAGGRRAGDLCAEPPAAEHAVPAEHRGRSRTWATRTTATTTSAHSRTRSFRTRRSPSTGHGRHRAAEPRGADQHHREPRRAAVWWPERPPSALCRRGQLPDRAPLSPRPATSAMTSTSRWGAPFAPIAARSVARTCKAASTGDLKFVYNLVAWGGANDERRNARRSASTFEAVGAPLLARFDFTAPRFPADVVASASAPLIVKNILFVSGVQSGNGTLRAYDTQPYRDVDNDGNPDDGGADLIFGTTYDEIWRAEAGDRGWRRGRCCSGQPSSPTYATVVNAAGQAQVIFVTLPDGRLQAYQAFPNTGSRHLRGRQPAVRDPGSPGKRRLPAGSGPVPHLLRGAGLRDGTGRPDPVRQCGRQGRALDTRSTGQRRRPRRLVPTGPATVGFTRLQAGATGSRRSKSRRQHARPDAVPARPGRHGCRPHPALLARRAQRGHGHAVNPTTWVYFTRIASSNGRYYVAKAPHPRARPQEVTDRSLRPWLAYTRRSPTQRLQDRPPELRGGSGF